MRMRDARRAVAALAVLFLAAGGARAHGLRVFARIEGGEVVGRVYFAGAGAAQRVPVVLLSANGERLGGAITDDDGRFAIRPTAAISEAEIQVVAETADGHRAAFPLRWAAGSAPPGSAAERPADAPDAASDAAAQASAPVGADDAAPAGRGELLAAVRAAVQEELGPLREQLDAAEHRARLHEVLGGIGYILGLMGLTLYLHARRLRERPAGRDRAARGPR